MVSLNPDLPDYQKRDCLVLAISGRMKDYSVDLTTLAAGLVRIADRVESVVYDQYKKYLLEQDPTIDQVNVLLRPYLSQVFIIPYKDSKQVKKASKEVFYILHTAKSLLVWAIFDVIVLQLQSNLKKTQDTEARNKQNSRLHHMASFLQQAEMQEIMRVALFVIKGQKLFSEKSNAMLAIELLTSSKPTETFITRASMAFVLTRYAMFFKFTGGEDKGAEYNRVGYYPFKKKLIECSRPYGLQWSTKASNTSDAQIQHSLHDSHKLEIPDNQKQVMRILLAEYFPPYFPRLMQHHAISFQSDYIIGILITFLEQENSDGFALDTFINALMAIHDAKTLESLIKSPLVALYVCYYACLPGILLRNQCDCKEPSLKKLLKEAANRRLGEKNFEVLLERLFPKIEQTLNIFSLEIPDFKKLISKGQQDFTRRKNGIEKFWPELKGTSNPVTKESVLGKIGECNFTVYDEQNPSEDCKILIDILFCCPQWTKEVVDKVLCLQQNKVLDGNLISVLRIPQCKILTFAFSHLFTNFSPQMQNITGFLWFISQLIDADKISLLKDLIPHLPLAVICALVQYLFFSGESSALAEVLAISNTLCKNTQKMLYFFVALKSKEDFPQLTKWLSSPAIIEAFQKRNTTLDPRELKKVLQEGLNQHYSRCMFTMPPPTKRGKHNQGSRDAFYALSKDESIKVLQNVFSCFFDGSPSFLSSIHAELTRLFKKKKRTINRIFVTSKPGVPTVLELDCKSSAMQVKTESHENSSLQIRDPGFKQPDYLSKATEEKSNGHFHPRKNGTTTSSISSGTTQNKEPEKTLEEQYKKKRKKRVASLLKSKRKRWSDKSGKK